MMRTVLVLGLMVILSPLSASAADPNASWTYAAFGTAVDILAVTQASSQPEIYLGGEDSRYWLALRYGAENGGYDQVYFSGYYRSSIVAVKVAEATGDSVEDIIVLTADGRIQIYDQINKALIGTITTPSGFYSGDIEIADLNGDGLNEIILCRSDHLYVYAASGALKWELDNVGGSCLTIAQMDADPSLEIATSDGNIIDAQTHTVQWNWTYGFGGQIEAADIDGDGYAELIVASDSYLWAYDVDRQLPKWSVAMSSSGVLLATDADVDGLPEILVGRHYYGDILLLDPVTLEQETIISTKSNIYSLALEDVDGDGRTELLWTDSSGLNIADWQSRRMEWQTPSTYAPFVGPEIGDLDGDGRNEVAVVSRGSGYSGGCALLIFDAVSRELRASSASILGGCYDIRDMKLRDADLDGRLDILTASPSGNPIGIVSFNGDNSFTLKWTASSSVSPSSVDAADIDNDLISEVVVGGSDGYVYVYGFTTGPDTQKWRSLYLRGAVEVLTAADTDDDGTKEVVAMVHDGDVYVFDGITKGLEAMIVGRFSAMRIQPVGGIPSIVLSNRDGELMIYRYASGAYTQTYREKLTNAAIEGFTVDWREHVWVRTAGSYYDDPGVLSEMTLDGVVLATYAGYGRNFGERVALSRCSRAVFIGGDYLVAAFPVEGAATCSPDFDGDGQSDVTVWRPESAVWCQLRSSVAGTYSCVPWGTATDRLVPADYDGDGLIDLAVWRPENGTWHIRSSAAWGSFLSFQWGGPAHKPVPGDYDGDGVTDLAVWDPTGGIWYVRPSKLPGTYSFTQWGLSGDIPVPEDYDGDGSIDPAVWRPGSGVWYIIPSGSPGTYLYVQWGRATDIPVPGDYDGDGKADIAVRRPGEGVWYILSSGSPGTYTSTQWGLPGDVPVTGDYDGDGKLDMGVWRPDSGVWYILPSGSPGTYTSTRWGLGTDVPVSSVTQVLGIMQDP